MRLLDYDLDKRMREKFELNLLQEEKIKDANGNYVLPYIDQGWDDYIQREFERSVEGMSEIINIANSMFIHAKKFEPNDSHVELHKNFQKSCDNNFAKTIKGYVETLLAQIKGVVTRGPDEKLPEGLYEKYSVRRVDGKEDPKGSEYFVLRISSGSQHDLKALEAYANSCAIDFPELSKDLYERAEYYRTIFGVKKNPTDFAVMDEMCARNMKINVSYSSENLVEAECKGKNGFVTIGCERHLVEELARGERIGALYLMDKKEFLQVKGVKK